MENRLIGKKIFLYEVLKKAFMTVFSIGAFYLIHKSGCHFFKENFPGRRNAFILKVDSEPLKILFIYFNFCINWNMVRNQSRCREITNLFIEGYYSTLFYFIFISCKKHIVKLRSKTITINTFLP